MRINHEKSLESIKNRMKKKKILSLSSKNLKNLKQNKRVII